MNILGLCGSAILASITIALCILIIGGAVKEVMNKK